MKINSDWNVMIVFKDILMIGGLIMKFIYLIINNHNFIGIIEKTLKYVKSFLILSNGNLLIGCFQNNIERDRLVEFKFENNNYIKIKAKDNSYQFPIYGLLEKNVKTIISCSSDRFIKFWKSV